MIVVKCCLWLHVSCNMFQVAMVGQNPESNDQQVDVDCVESLLRIVS